MKQLIIAILFAATTVFAQPVLTNLPTVTLGSEKMAIAEGILTEGSTTRATTLFDYNVTDAFFLRGESQLQTGSELFHSLSLGGGLYRSWEHARVYGFILGGRNFETDGWEIGAGFGAAYTPFQNGIAERFSVFSEFRVVTDFQARTDPSRIVCAGVRYSF